MNAVGVLWRSRLRRHWRVWVATTLLLGLGAGAGLACLAGARRTASSFDRIALTAEYPDIVSSHGFDPTEAAEIIDGFEGVAGHSTQVGFAGFVEGLDPTLIKYFIGSWGEPLSYGRPLLKDGRYPRPDQAGEVVVAGRGVDAAGIEPGDELTLRFFLSDFSDMVTETFVVTGTGADALEVAADASQDRSAIYFTPAFTGANASRLQAWSASRFVTGPGNEGDRDLATQILSVGWSVDETRIAAQARVQDAIRPLIVALALLGALVLVATLVLVGQALARQAEAGRREGATARAVGFTRSQVDLVELLTALAIGVPGALLAVATAAALSPFAPVGAVRRLEPARGFAVDLTVLGLGASGLLLVIVLADRPRPHLSIRADRTVARPLLAGAATGPSMSSGLSLAAGGTTAQRRRFWATVGLSAGALALVVAGIAFISALA